MKVIASLVCMAQPRQLFAAVILASLFCPSGAIAADLTLGTDEDPALQKIAAEYYSKKHGVDLDEAHRRLAIQDRASGIEDDLASVLRSEYAGIWFDPDDNGRLKIGMTQAGMRSEKDVQALLDRFAVAPDTDVVAVRFTEADLERKVSELNRSLSIMLDNGRVRTSYSTKTNRVVVTALHALSPEEKQLVEQAGTRDGVTVRRMDLPTLRGRLQACGVRTCELPFRGGREIASIVKFSNFPPLAKLCTAAFIARHRATGEWLAMTAGHCLTKPAFSTWGSKNEHHNWSELGNTYGWVFPGMDAGVVHIGSYYWTIVQPMPWVVVKSSDDTAYDPQYPIRKDGKSSLHSIKCVTGRTTGTHCGEVIELGASGNMVDPNGNSHPLQNMGVIDECISQEGDSGGPVYKAKTAYGILVGILPTPDSSCNEYYQGIRAAENAMNVDVQFAP